MMKLRAYLVKSEKGKKYIWCDLVLVKSWQALCGIPGAHGTNSLVAAAGKRVGYAHQVLTTPLSMRETPGG